MRARIRRVALLALLALLVPLVACGAEPASTPASVSASPSETADAPGSDPTDIAYVEWRGGSLTVIESAEADALFETVTNCTNEEYRFTVDYPASWHTNEGGQAPACSWFGSSPFATGSDARLVALARPVEVPIGIMVVRTGLGQIMEQPRLFSEVVTIAGFEGARTEDLIQPQPAWVSYGYSAWLDEDPTGLKLLAGTTSAADGDYVLNKAVLDRMMATLEFED